MKNVKLKFLIITILFLVVLGSFFAFFWYQEQERQRIAENTEMVDLSIVEKVKKENILKQAIENQYHLSGVEAEVFESTVEVKIKADENLFQIEPLKRGEGEAVSPWKNLNRVRIRGKVIANPKKNFYTLLTENNQKINFLVSTIADQQDKTYDFYMTCQEENDKYCKSCLTSFYLRNSINLNSNIQYEKEKIRKLSQGEMVVIIIKSLPREEVVNPKKYLGDDFSKRDFDQSKFFKELDNPTYDDILDRNNWQLLEFIHSKGDDYDNVQDSYIYNASGVIIYEN